MRPTCPAITPRGHVCRRTHIRRTDRRLLWSLCPHFGVSVSLCPEGLSAPVFLPLLVFLFRSLLNFSQHGCAVTLTVSLAVTLRCHLLAGAVLTADVFRCPVSVRFDWTRYRGAKTTSCHKSNKSNMSDFLCVCVFV